MEKKTIGKFISVLRKANGMTQKELGDKLYVSDKTVSRWECDECVPELALIPLIAEIFKITTDELLRGEKTNPEQKSAVSEETMSNHKRRSDKQFKLMLEKQRRQYKNFSLISIGIAILGFITAAIVNLGFTKGLIAFCFASAFIVASVISQICFAINARIISYDDDEKAYVCFIQNENSKIVKTAINVVFVNLLIWAFCLPLATIEDGANYGLSFESWFVWGFIFAVVLFVIAYIFYVFIVEKMLWQHRLIYPTEEETETRIQSNAFLKKMLKSSVLVALFLAVCIGTWNIIGWQSFLKINQFDTCTEFKTFMENEYDTWYTQVYGEVYVNGEKVELKPGDPDYPHKVNPQLVYGSITNHKGDEICSYYYNPDLYWKIEFTASSEDKMPATVITTSSVYAARNIFFVTQTILYAFIIFDFVIFSCVYANKIRKLKKN